MFFWVLLTSLSIASASNQRKTSNECSGDCLANYEICRNVHAHGATRFDDVKTEDQCKARCLMEDECKAVDWNFRKVECWLHRAYDKPLAPNNKVNHYIKCSEDYGEWAAGFPTIDRNHYYHDESYVNDETGYPVVIMVPPPGSPAAITKEAMAWLYIIYIKGGLGSDSLVIIGVARPYEDGGFDIIKYESLPAPPRKRKPWDRPISIVRNDFQVQPGDVLFIGAYSHGESGVAVPYDIGDPAICGTSYKATFHNDPPVITNVTTMSECWMLSLELDLKKTS